MSAPVPAEQAKIHPYVLLISGADPTCGAGVSVDVRTACSTGVRPLIAITALTAQTDSAYLNSHVPPPESLQAQLSAAERQSSSNLAAVKIGMLPDVPSVRIVTEFLKRHRPPNVVFDPVLVSTSGGVLASESALEAMKELLFPLLSVLTPNLLEVQKITGVTVKNEEDLPAAAEQILEYGSKAVYLKGGHMKGDECVDLLHARDQGELRRYRHPCLLGPSPRGTGCRLATSLASQLALGRDLLQATEAARDYVQQYLRRTLS